MTRRKKRQRQDHTGAFAVLAFWLFVLFVFAFWVSNRPRVPRHFLDCNQPTHSRR